MTCGIRCRALGAAAPAAPREGAHGAHTHGPRRAQVERDGFSLAGRGGADAGDELTAGSWGLIEPGRTGHFFCRRFPSLFFSFSLLFFIFIIIFFSVYASGVDACRRRQTRRRFRLISPASFSSSNLIPFLLKKSLSSFVLLLSLSLTWTRFIWLGRWWWYEAAVTKMVMADTNWNLYF